MQILVGTASWTDKTLIACGRFYPPAVKTPEARLRYYATRFPMVEVDASYHAIPTPASARAWAERTPADFVFNLKAFRLFTGHQTPLQFLHRDLQQALAPQGRHLLYEDDMPTEIVDTLWQRFHESLAPLEQAGKLEAVHFQFAPWVRCDARGRARVEACARRMAGRRMAVEFRHASWFTPRTTALTLDWLRALGVVHVVADEPQGFTNSVPAIWAATHPDLAILRLHGRNSAAWNQKGLTASSSRFDYDYAAHELAAMVPAIVGLARQVKRMQVVFNNNMEDQMQRNGLALQQLLRSFDDGAGASA